MAAAAQLEVEGMAKDNVVWEVSVDTSTVPGAATDADVTLELRGPGGASTGIMALSSSLTYSNPFESGHTDIFRVTGRNLDMIEGLRVAHTSKGMFAPWHCAAIRVTNLQSGQEWTFPCDKWISKKANDGRTDSGAVYRDLVPQVVADPDHLAFLQQTKRRTATTSPAGDKSKKNGDILSSSLSSTRRRWQGRSIDHYPVETEAASAAAALGATTSLLGLLSKDKASDSASIAVSGPRETVVYAVEVETSSLKNAETRAHVYVTLYGSLGNAGPRLLADGQAKGANDGQVFRAGAKDRFSLRCQDIGYIKALRLAHDNSGSGAAWHVAVVRVYDGKRDTTTVFPCRKWLSARETDGSMGSIFRMLQPIEATDQEQNMAVFGAASGTGTIAATTTTVGNSTLRGRRAMPTPAVRTLDPATAAARILARPEFNLGSGVADGIVKEVVEEEEVPPVDGLFTSLKQLHAVASVSDGERRFEPESTWRQRVASTTWLVRHGLATNCLGIEDIKRLPPRSVPRYESTLRAAADLYRRRLAFLNQWPAPAFGLRLGENVAVLVDAHHPNAARLVRALQRWLEKALVHCQTFTLVRADSSGPPKRLGPLRPTSGALDQAFNWLQKLDPAAVSLGMRSGEMRVNEIEASESLSPADFIEATSMRVSRAAVALVKETLGMGIGRSSDGRSGGDRDRDLVRHTYNERGSDLLLGLQTILAVPNVDRVYAVLGQHPQRLVEATLPHFAEMYTRHDLPSVDFVAFLLPKDDPQRDLVRVSLRALADVCRGRFHQYDGNSYTGDDVILVQREARDCAAALAALQTRKQTMQVKAPPSQEMQKRQQVRAAADDAARKERVARRQRLKTLRAQAAAAGSAGAADAAGEYARRQAELRRLQAEVGAEEVRAGVTQRKTNAASIAGDDELARPADIFPPFLATKDWLKENGLHARRLEPEQALGDVAYSCSKPGLYIGTNYKSMAVLPWHDGTERAMHVDPGRLIYYRRRLLRTLKLYNGRIIWLGTGPRRLVGNVVEPVVTLVIDTSAAARPRLALLKAHLQKVLSEQLPHCTHFNIVRYDTEATKFRPEVVETSARNLRKAWAWVNDWDADTVVSGCNLLRAVTVACDALRPQKYGVHGIYLVATASGDQPSSEVVGFAGELVAGAATRIHTTAYCCHGNAVAARTLQGLASATGGRYHVVHEEGSPLDEVHTDDVSWANDPAALHPEPVTSKAKKSWGRLKKESNVDVGGGGGGLLARLKKVNIAGVDNTATAAASDFSGKQGQSKTENESQSQTAKEKKTGEHTVSADLAAADATTVVGGRGGEKEIDTAADAETVAASTATVAAAIEEPAPPPSVTGKSTGTTPFQMLADWMESRTRTELDKVLAVEGENHRANVCFVLGDDLEALRAEITRCRSFLAIVDNVINSLPTEYAAAAMEVAKEANVPLPETEAQARERRASRRNSSGVGRRDSATVGIKTAHAVSNSKSTSVEADRPDAELRRRKEATRRKRAAELKATLAAAKEKESGHRKKGGKKGRKGASGTRFLRINTGPGGRSPDNVYGAGPTARLRSRGGPPPRLSVSFPVAQKYMASSAWVKRYGVTRKGLDLERYIAARCVLHQPEVVPNTGGIAEGSYHESFPLTMPSNYKKKDGMHAHYLLTLEAADWRQYEEQAQKAVVYYEDRLDWLTSGHRAVFGQVLEKRICLLVDTSGSMHAHMPFLQRQLRDLLLEQVAERCEAFCIVEYADEARAWTDCMVDASEDTCRAAGSWVRTLEARGGTSLKEALNFAYGLCESLAGRKEGPDAIYVISDGMPDTSSRHLIESAKKRCTELELAMHTISFAAQPAKETDAFLQDLAAVGIGGGGRFHRFTRRLPDATLDRFYDAEGRFRQEAFDTAAEVESSGTDIDVVRAQLENMRSALEKAVGYRERLREIRQEAASSSAAAAANKARPTTVAWNEGARSKRRAHAATTGDAVGGTRIRPSTADAMRTSRSSIVSAGGGRMPVARETRSSVLRQAWTAATTLSVRTDSEIGNGDGEGGGTDGALRGEEEEKEQGATAAERIATTMRGRSVTASTRLRAPPPRSRHTRVRRLASTLPAAADESESNGWSSTECGSDGGTEYDLEWRLAQFSDDELPLPRKRDPGRMAPHAMSATGLLFSHVAPPDGGSAPSRALPPPPDPHVVFVRNLVDEASPADLEETFAAHCGGLRPLEVHMPWDERNDRSRGIAYASFASAREALVALRASGAPIHGQAIIVSPGVAPGTTELRAPTEMVGRSASFAQHPSTAVFEAEAKATAMLLAGDRVTT